jgi:hypothetical protein
VLRVESGPADRNNKQDIPLDTQTEMPVFPAFQDRYLGTAAAAALGDF